MQNVKRNSIDGQTPEEDAYTMQAMRQYLVSQDEEGLCLMWIREIEKDARLQVESEGMIW